MKIFLTEMQLLNIVDQLLQPRADGKASLVRHVPEKDVKISDPVLQSRLKIPIAHGQLIEVAEHGHIQLFFRFHNFLHRLRRSGRSRCFPADDYSAR